MRCWVYLAIVLAFCKYAQVESCNNIGKIKTASLQQEATSRYSRNTFEHHAILRREFARMVPSYLIVFAVELSPYVFSCCYLLTQCVEEHVSYVKAAVGRDRFTLTSDKITHLRRLFFGIGCFFSRFCMLTT